MATTLESKSKHLTNAEKQVMAAAEAACLPTRPVNLKPPKELSAQEKKQWKSILTRMDSLQILDDLDAETLTVFCQMYARRASLLEDLQADMAPKDRAALEKRLQSLERSLLTYAEHLGLTPRGRVALARKKAAQSLDDADPMFGD